MSTPVSQEPDSISFHLVPNSSLDLQQVVHAEVEKIGEEQDVEIQRLKGVLHFYVEGPDGEREIFTPENYDQLLASYVQAKMKIRDELAAKLGRPLPLSEVKVDIDLTNKASLSKPGLAGLYRGLASVDDESYEIDVDQPEVVAFRDAVHKNKGKKTVQFSSGLYKQGFKGNLNSSRLNTDYSVSDRVKALPDYDDLVDEIDGWIKDLPSDDLKELATRRVAAHEMAVAALTFRLEEMRDLKNAELAKAGTTPKQKQKLTFEIQKINGFLGQVNELKHFGTLYVLSHPKADGISTIKHAKTIEEGVAKFIEEKKMPQPPVPLLKIERAPKTQGELNEPEKLFAKDVAGSSVRGQPLFAQWSKDNKVPQSRDSIQEFLFGNLATQLTEDPQTLNPNNPHQFPQLVGGFNLGPHLNWDQDLRLELGTKLAEDFAQISRMVKKKPADLATPSAYIASAKTKYKTDSIAAKAAKAAHDALEPPAAQQQPVPTPPNSQPGSPRSSIGSDGGASLLSQKPESSEIEESDDEDFRLADPREVRRQAQEDASKANAQNTEISDISELP